MINKDCVVCEQIRKSKGIWFDHEHRKERKFSVVSEKKFKEKVGK